jgi:hypothetical protein
MLPAAFPVADQKGQPDAFYSHAVQRDGHLGRTALHI